MINAQGALAILGGGGGGGVGSSGVSALSIFRSYNRDQVAQRKAFAEQPDVQRRVDNFKRDIKDLNTVDELLGDRRALEFTLTAFGLEADINNVGKLRAVLNSDPDDINSFANRLNDPRYGEFAKFIGGPAFGLKNLQIPSKQAEVIDKYLTNRFEQSLGAQNPAVRDALFFLRRINTVENTFEILGDLPLRGIVTDALNLPQEIARQSVQKQASLIDAKLDLDALRGTTEGEESRSRLELFQADRAALSTGEKQIAAALGQVNTLVGQLDSLRSAYGDIANIVDPAGVNAAEIAVQEPAIPDLLRQQGLVSAAEQAVERTDTALNTLNTLFNQARSADDATAFQDIQAEFLALADDLLADDGILNGATFTDPNTGLTQNLLRNGTGGGLPPGIDPTAAQIATTVDTDGTQAITNSTDVAGFLADLQSVRDGFAAASYASVDADLDAIEGTFDGAVDDFGATRSTVQINASSLQFALGQTTFATELDSASLALGKSSLDDSLSRIEQVDALLVDIANIARQADLAGADLAALNDSYASKVNELTSVLSTPGSVTDGTTTVTYDNLLTDGSVDYTVLAGTQARAEGFDLDSTILANLPGSLDGSNGDALADTVLDTYRDEVATARSALQRDLGVLGYAADQLDPRGRLDAEIRSIAAELDATIAKAEVGGVNLIDAFGRDGRVTLENNGATLTIEAQTLFEGNFSAAIEAVQTTILTGGDDDARIAAVNGAYFVAGSAQSRLQAENYALDIQQGIVDENIALLQQETQAGDFFKPIEYTDEALRFIEKYLIQKDLESQGFGGAGGTGTFNRNAGLSTLLAQAGGSTNLLA